MKTFSAFVAASLCLSAVTAHAQQKTDSSQQASPSQQARAALNRQQAEYARHQLEQNAANRRAYQAAMAARAAKIQQQRQTHDAAVAAHDAKVQRYKEAMRQWRADVAACKAGDRDRCAHKKPAS